VKRGGGSGVCRIIRRDTMTDLRRHTYGTVGVEPALPLRRRYGTSREYQTEKPGKNEPNRGAIVSFCRTL
jgi:hypothetical protein